MVITDQLSESENGILPYKDRNAHQCNLCSRKILDRSIAGPKSRFPYIYWVHECCGFPSVFICNECCRLYKNDLMADLIHSSAILQIRELVPEHTLICEMIINRDWEFTNKRACPPKKT
jgi:hypothetical protein